MVGIIVNLNLSSANTALKGIVNERPLNAAELLRLRRTINPEIRNVLEVADRKFVSNDRAGLKKMFEKGRINKNYFAKKAIDLFHEGKEKQANEVMKIAGITVPYVAEYAITIGNAKVAAGKYDTATVVHSVAMDLVTGYQLNGQILKGVIELQNMIYV
jgi:hypothetical protein